jgi:hypothetical protein
MLTELFLACTVICSLWGDLCIQPEFVTQALGDSWTAVNKAEHMVEFSIRVQARRVHIFSTMISHASEIPWKGNIPNCAMKEESILWDDSKPCPELFVSRLLPLPICLLFPTQVFEC